MDETLKSNVTSSKSWLRLVFMIVFAVCLQVAAFVMWILVVLQFLFALVKGEDNSNLREFGSSLSKFIYQALRFVTYNTDDKPFPFADWPKPDVIPPSDAAAEVVQETSNDSAPEEASGELVASSTEPVVEEPQQDDSVAEPVSECDGLEDTVSEDTVSEDTVSEDTVSEDTTSENTKDRGSEKA